MKLDEQVIDEIIDEIWRYETSYRDAVNFLKSLNLVFKSGDSSQSTLVESNAK